MYTITNIVRYIKLLYKYYTVLKEVILLQFRIYLIKTKLIFKSIHFHIALSIMYIDDRY